MKAVQFLTLKMFYSMEAQVQQANLLDKKYY